MKDKDLIKDNIYSDPLGQVADFVFDDAVVKVFPDMINRSVPGYATIIAVTAVLAEKYTLTDTLIYDLGCSLGATSIAVAEVSAPGCQVIAVDSSSAMVAALQDKLRMLPCLKTPIEVIHDRIETLEMRHCSMVTMNFTLQFIPLDERLALMKKIAGSLLPGGILVLSEKIQLPGQESNELFIDLHHNFKRRNGYSSLEISQKRDAIENVLLPETLATHRARLIEAGFAQVEVWFQCFNFVSIIAFNR